MLGRLIRGCGVAAILVLLAAPSAFGQATGKIQGRVVDQATGEPIAGATVRVLGTTRGGITGEDGFYFINEVPAGLRTIVAEFLGRRTFQLENQRVLAGQTTTLNFSLEMAPIEIEPLVVEGERNPLVPRDQVSSKAIVTGELIDALPIDNASSIVVLQPGVISTNQGRTIRGSRPNEEAVYVDGVLTRRYLTGEAEPIELPPNALAEVSVTTGGIGAQFSDAQSGVINYVTRTGGTDFGGSFSIFTDQLGPKDWRTGFNRLEFTFGGPLLREQNLSFFLAGQAQGQKYSGLNDGWNEIPILVNDGVASFSDLDPTTAERAANRFGMSSTSDAMFSLPRESNALDGTDSVLVAMPSYTSWDNGNNRPFNQSDEYTFLGKLNWGLGGGSNIDFSYKRERDQGAGRGLGSLYNPDAMTAFLNQADVLTLGGYFLIKQTATSALALDVKASYQRYYDQSGLANPDWLLDNQNPFMGFNFGNVDFLIDAEDWPVSEAIMNGARSNAIPAESLQAFPNRFDLASRQGLPGVAGNLRLNPYAMKVNWSTGGYTTDALFLTKERNWVFSGNVDWQAGRYFRLQAGGDLGLLSVNDMYVPTYSSRSAPAMYDPKRGGLFATGRLDLGDVVIDAGLRWDYFNANGDFPIVPGYVFNVPDSLKADFVTLEAYDPANPRPLEDRLVPLEDCGGALTAPSRTRPDGTVVCKPNFIKSEAKSEFSPKLGVSFPVTVKSTFRLSYSHNVQTIPLGTSDAGVVAAQFGYFRNIYDDLAGGRANTNTDYGRDVDMPRTVLFEAGYRQLIGEDLVVDLAAYSKTTRNGVSVRKVQYENPNEIGQSIFINSAVNADYTQIRGVDVRVDKRFGQFADLSANYSFIDARGTGSDPYTYIDLLFRRNTNLSVITGQPIIPPDVILPLEQSRRHNFAGTFSLLFPQDYQQGTTIGSILSDFGVFATFFVASGLPYTRLQNSANGQTGPPTFAGLGGTVEEELNSSSMPWTKQLDLRFTKGFPVAGTRMQLFVDWRNPLNLTNTTSIFLETGTEFNQAFRDKQVNQQLTDALLDGDTDIDDFDILRESPENDANIFSLLQAENRYGDGDGIFTVDEQREAFGAWYDMFWGSQNFVNSTQRLRLGLEINF
ncbi:MAG: TonB-dependent receptor [Gemmatimonadota bacterium]|nr:MAG: TonB-dependent receptor [Gemmatimonadota bacterium]